MVCPKCSSLEKNCLRLPNSLVVASNCYADRLVRVNSCPAADVPCGEAGRVRPPVRPPPMGPPFVLICQGNLCQPPRMACGSVGIRIFSVLQFLTAFSNWLQPLRVCAGTAANFRPVALRPTISPACPNIRMFAAQPRDPVPTFCAGVSTANFLDLCPVRSSFSLQEAPPLHKQAFWYRIYSPFLCGQGFFFVSSLSYHDSTMNCKYLRKILHIN